MDARFGDCEDFALTKRSRLIRLGYPPRALRIKIVSRFQINDPVILEVATTRKMYTFDIRRNYMLEIAAWVWIAGAMVLLLAYALGNNFRRMDRPDNTGAKQSAWRLLVTAIFWPIGLVWVLWATILDRARR